MSYQPIGQERSASKTMIAAGVLGVSACFALGMALGANTSSQMFMQPAVQASTRVQPMTAVHQMHQGFAPRAQAFPIQAAEAQEAPLYEYQAVAQAQESGLGRIGLLSCISAVAAAVAFAVQALVRNQSDETIALAPYSSESLERRRRLIEQENARRRAEGLATIAAPAGPESDAERRARLIRQQQEYAASVGAAPAPAPTSAAPGSGWAVDWQAVRQDLLDLMNSDPTYDDGTYAPLFIRLAWHSSGTYQARDNSGGSSGAGMRFPDGHEIRDPENAGLDLAMHFLEPIKNKYPGLSYSDLWILAALVGIEKTGGPNIEFRPGRKDSAHPSEAPANGRLPGAEYGTREGLDAEGRVNGWENLAQHVRDVFYRMGFNDREIVALLCGGHVYGRCHYERSGYMGPWVAEPWKFSNEYAADMIDDEWICVGNDTLVDGKPIDQRVRPAPGRRQYVSKMTGSHAPDSSPTKNEIPQMMLVSDMVLLWDANFKQHLEVFAEDEEALKVEFGAAYKKLTELGVGSMDVCPYAKMAAAY